MRALIVKEPWLSMILAGEKTWEIRGETCTFRERIGLIRKGSGHVFGTVEVVDALGPLSPSELLENADKHRATVADLAVMSYPTPYAWVLEEPCTFLVPRPYVHPNGAVKWVNIPDIPAEEG